MSRSTNPNPHANGKLPKPLLQQPKPPLPNATEFVQINYLQRLILWRAGRKECTDIGLARLCAAYAVLGERKRVLRGIPLPGQLRPDLDPVQLAKALRRQGSRQITDVQQVHRATFTDEPEKKEEAKPKESLQTQEGDHGTGGGDGMGTSGAL